MTSGSIAASTNSRDRKVSTSLRNCAPYSAAADAASRSYASAMTRSDTVGFIRNLPHTLVTSFRATLEEVERAELLLHVRDASSPMLEEQKAQVEEVLGELDVAGKPVVEVMNKIDLVDEEKRDSLNRQGRVLTSGLMHQGLGELLKAIDAGLVADPVIEMELRLPQSEGAIIAALEAGAILSGKRFEGNLVYVTAKGPASLLNRYRRFQVRPALN